MNARIGIAAAACILVMTGSAASAQVRAQTPAYSAKTDDIAAVERAAFDYIDAIYRSDPTRIERSVHPELKKVGYYTNDDGKWAESPMTYTQLLEVARNWNRDGRTLRADAPREVVIYEVLDHTASAKVVAQWGIDYLQLVKYADGWKIRHILWQQPPRDGAR